MSKYTTMPPTEMSNCEAGVGGIHCHTATAKAKELSQQSAKATHRLRIAAVLCIFFIAGEVRITTTKKTHTHTQYFKMFRLVMLILSIFHRLSGAT